MFKPPHCGLYFTEEHLKRAQENSHRAPFKDGLELLVKTEQTSTLAMLYWGGMRYRFRDNVDAGQAVLPILNTDMLSATVYENILENPESYRDALRNMVTLAQCFELLRNHPDYINKERDGWLEIFSGYVDNLRQRVHDPTLSETLWIATLNVASGIVLENKLLFDAGVAIFYHTINEGVHPEGYIPGVLEEDGDTLENALSAITALTLIAEMASHTGLDLWKHTNRGISILTAAAYPLYYYFYPEKWRWDGEGVVMTEARAKPLFHQYNGFLEIINLRYERPLKAIQMILDDMRPIYDLYGGGLTTLTHAEPQKRWWERLFITTKNKNG